MMTCLLMSAARCFKGSRCLYLQGQAVQEYTHWKNTVYYTGEGDERRWGWQANWSDNVMQLAGPCILDGIVVQLSCTTECRVAVSDSKLTL